MMDAKTLPSIVITVLFFSQSAAFIASVWTQSDGASGAIGAKIEGIVTDGNGNPVEGATVSIEGVDLSLTVNNVDTFEEFIWDTATLTDANGSFAIEVEDGDHSIFISVSKPGFIRTRI